MIREWNSLLSLWELTLAVMEKGLLVRVEEMKRALNQRGDDDGNQVKGKTIGIIKVRDYWFQLVCQHMKLHQTELKEFWK